MNSTIYLFLLLVIVALVGCRESPQMMSPSEPEFTPIPLEFQRPPGNYNGAITINEVTRKFNTHIPPGYQPGVPTPLVLNLHGRGGTVNNHEQISQMNARADEQGFIVVSPQAIGEPSTWWPASGPKGQADLEFFQMLIATLESQHSIDPARIYVTGFSNGGAMANRLACTLANKIAAIAPVAGAHPQMETCEASLPVAVLAIHAIDDPIIPYKGDGDYLTAVPAWTSAWAQRNECGLIPEVDISHATYKWETWSDCAGDASVILYTIDGGGHTWPGSGLGYSSDIYASDIIWAFFEAHPKVLP